MYSNVLMRETLCLLFITAAVPKIYSEAVCLNVCSADGAVLMVALKCHFLVQVIPGF